MIQLKSEIKLVLDQMFEEAWTRKENALPDEIILSSSTKFYSNGELIKVIVEWSDDDNIIMRIKKQN